jgi:hypothetical protein
MDIDAQFLHKALGDTGILGAVLLSVGVVCFGTESRTEGLGALALSVGSALVTVGLMNGFLRAMGMEFEDLQ